MLAEKIAKVERVECIARAFVRTRIERLSAATSLLSQLHRA